MADENLSIARWYERYTIPVTESGCWLFVQHINANGYGMVGVNRKMRHAHRVSYEISRGPIPAGLVVCHSCDVRSCVNPAHLFVGTESDNQQDCLKKGRQAQARKTHCKQGHAYDESNTWIYVSKNGVERRCKACMRRNSASWKRRTGYKAPNK